MEAPRVMRGARWSWVAVVVAMGVAGCVATSESTDPRVRILADCDGDGVRDTDLLRNPNSCGACGNRCVGDDTHVASCVDGYCELRCDWLHADCNGDPTDGCEAVLGTTEHCGGCGRRCTERGENGQSRCEFSSTCVFRCDYGFGDCNRDTGDGCETTLISDRNNCGYCGQRCADGEACVDGECALTCPDGLTACGRECRSLNTNTDCGACGHRCPASATCVDGECRCAAGMIYCSAYMCRFDGGACVPSSDANCSVCDHRCGARSFGTSRCVSDRCVLACDLGHADCDGDEANGCEVTTDDNPAHCGACGRPCAAGEACVRGVCSIPAPRPWRPQSLGVVTSHRPTFGWHLPEGVDDVHLEVCGDRECARVEREVDVTAESHRFTEPFGVGVHYWRLRSRRGGSAVAEFGPTWLFSVAARDLAVDTSWPLAGGEDGSVGPLPTLLGAFNEVRSQGCAISQEWTEVRDLDFAGDLNGDGFGDYRGDGADYWLNLSGPGHRETSFSFTVYGSGSVQWSG